MNIFRFCKILFVLSILLSIPGCAAKVSGPYQASKTMTAKTIFVTSHGWHTGIVIPVQHISKKIWPESQEFKNFDYIEVGWGDEGFYRAKKVTARITLKAILWPTKSVLHVVGFNGPVEAYFSESGIVAINLSEKGFNELCGYISEVYYKDQTGKQLFLGKGLYGKSRFYRANGKYYFPKTCNVWTAKVLRVAGCPIKPVFAQRAANVLSQTKKFGVVVQEAKK